MSCGCGQNNNVEHEQSPGVAGDFADILEGDKKLSLVQAVQLLAGLVTIIGIVKYLGE